MELAPEKIRKNYRNTPPYQVKDVMKNYIGQKIYWDLRYYSATQQKDLNLKISLFGLDSSELVVCEIKEDAFPLIKILPKETPVRLVGTIRSIDSISIEIENAQLHAIKDGSGQIYFPQGSREELLAFLESKVLGANDIKIYDSYPSDDILKLLESASPKAEIKLLGKNIDAAFSEKVKAFNTYFSRNMLAKKIDVSHARFYIIDDEVLQVDSSLKNYGGNKATMIHLIIKEAAEAVKKDFDKWWDEAYEI